MPDIGMCLNTSCVKRMKCYRYRAIPNSYRQSYGGFTTDTEGNCDYFWPLEKASTKLQLENELK